MILSTLEDGKLLLKLFSLSLNKAISDDLKNIGQCFDAVKNRQGVTVSVHTDLRNSDLFHNDLPSAALREPLSGGTNNNR